MEKECSTQNRHRRKCVESYRVRIHDFKQLLRHFQRRSELLSILPNYPRHIRCENKSRWRTGKATNALTLTMTSIVGNLGSTSMVGERKFSTRRKNRLKCKNFGTDQIPIIGASIPFKVEENCGLWSAVGSRGPIAAVIDENGRTFDFYSRGIYAHPPWNPGPHHETCARGR